MPSVDPRVAAVLAMTKGPAVHLIARPCDMDISWSDLAEMSDSWTAVCHHNGLFHAPVRYTTPERSAAISMQTCRTQGSSRCCVFR